MNTQEWLTIDGVEFLIVKSYTNEDDEMQSLVVAGLKGYHVCMRDLDSGEFLPQTRIFPYDKFDGDAAAKDYARFIVYGRRTQDDTPSLEAPWFAHK